MSSKLYFSICFYAVAVVSTTAFGAAYSVTDLGTLGGPESSAAAINSHGHVVGYSDTSDSQFPRQAFLYDGVMHPLGTLGGRRSGALDINDNGAVVGWAELSVSSTDHHAFRYDGVMHDLGTLGGDDSRATGINNNGVIVGVSETNLQARRGFILDGTLHDLGTFGGTSSNANAVNSSGHIVGLAQNSILNIQPYLYDGVMTDLGAPAGGFFGEATAVNDDNWVAGSWGFYLAGSRIHVHPFLYDGAMHDLGALVPDALTYQSHGEALGVNVHGQVVGRSQALDGQYHAFIYTHDIGMVDLNSLIDPSSGWQISDATDINDSGLIVGSGRRGGVTRALLLTPVDAPTPLPPPSTRPAVTIGGAPGLWGREVAVTNFSGPGLNSGSTNTVGAIVGAGLEFDDFGNSGLFDIDLTNNSVVITATSDQGVLNFETLRFTDVDNAIRRVVAVYVNSDTDWAGFDASRLAIDGDMFNVNFSGLAGLAGQRIVLDLSIVPEPSALCLFAVAIVAIGCSHRSAQEARRRSPSARSSESED